MSTSFQVFYERELSPTLRMIKKHRKSIVSKRLQYSIPTAVALCLIAYFLHKKYGLHLQIIIFVLVGGLSTLFYFLAKIPANYKSIYKREIIGRIIHKIDPKLRYQPREMISENEYIHSNIFAQKFDRYYGDDYISGKIEEVDFRFSELHVEKIIRNKKNKQRQTIFAGFFFVADFHKPLKSRTYIHPDRLESSLGFIARKFQKMNFTRPPLVELEDPSFEKVFSVYSEDQIEARYILSTAMMEKILRLQKNLDRKMHFSFVNSMIYIAIETLDNMFEPSLFGKIADEKRLESYYYTLQEIMSIIHALSLNRKIWKSV